MADTTSSNLLDAARRHLLRSLDETTLQEVGDRQAWEQFYQRYQEVLTRFAYKLSFQSEEVEDLLQDVWCEVIRQLPQFQYDRDRGGFRRWLYIIVRRRAIDHARRRKVRAEVQMPATSFFGSGLRDLRAPDPTANLDQQFKVEILKESISILRKNSSSVEWETFSLCRLQGHNSIEAAQRLGATPEAVRKRLERVSAKLRAAIIELVGTGSEIDL